jgi:hypothetical protein
MTDPNEVRLRIVQAVDGVRRGYGQLLLRRTDRVAPANDGKRSRVDLSPGSVAGVAGRKIGQADWGWFPALTVPTAVGIVLIVIGDALSRSTLSSSQAFFWVGLLVLYVPIVLRLCSPGAGRSERVVLVILLGLSLYLVKVLHDPFGFTFADELAHTPNANAILHTHELFHSNSILPVTAYYPGLESLAAALAAMSGLSAFGAGLILIGAARVAMMLALFLLFERLSGSARVAALGAAIYAANANFVFFSAQFSYESLALPLLVVVLLAVVEWRNTASRTGWAAVALLLTVAVVATHHLTSYALVMVLIAWSLAARIVGTKSGRPGPWQFALFALVAAAGWLTFVASTTVGYLTPAFTSAFLSTLHTVSGEAAPRQLFVSADTGYQAPLLERAVGIGSVLLMAAAFPFGLRVLWRRYRDEPLALVFAIAGAGFFATVVLRFAPGAWETANRASEFLFLGLGYVLALIGLDRWSPRRVPWIGPAAMSACLAIVFAGGVISGWTPDLRLSQPYRIRAGSHAINAEGRQLARWAVVELGPGRRFAASDADARLLASYASAFAITGTFPDVKDVLKTSALAPWELAILRDYRLRYVAVDRRDRSFDSQAGYFFGRRPEAGVPDTLLPLQVEEKFDRIRADRLYDSGDIVIFDMGPTG